MFLPKKGLFTAMMINHIHCTSPILQNVVAAAAAGSDESAETSEEEEVRDEQQRSKQ